MIWSQNFLKYPIITFFLPENNLMLLPGEQCWEEKAQADGGDGVGQQEDKDQGWTGEG